MTLNTPPVPTTSAAPGVRLMLKPLILLPIALGLTGCALAPANNTTATPIAAQLTGQVHGGQQPVAGALIQLYAAGTTGYGTAATPLLTNAVHSNATGGFSITSDYTCPANAQVYLTATGGNPGLAPSTNNAALAMMTALGPCSSLSASTFINVNELTTVASVWSLARFLSDVPQLSTSPTNLTGLTNAFAAVNQVVNTSTGTMPGPALPTNATLPTTRLNTLADILSACINTAGGTSGDGSPCGNLFTAATPAGAAAPTNTLAAAALIARNPASQVAALFALSVSNAPFQPTLTAAPNNFLIGVSYTGGGLAAPRALAIDPSGTIWLANTAASTLTQFAPTGAPISPTTGYTGGGLNMPSALAADTTGTIWITNQGTSTISRFSASGTPLTGTPYTGGGLSTPSSIAIDTAGNAWITNRTTSTVSEFSPTGTALSPTTGYTGAGLSQPVAIAIDPR